MVDAAHSWGKFSASSTDLPLLFGCYGSHGLALEVGQLRLEVVQALHGIVPALLECRRDQTIARIDCFIASLCEIGLVAGAFDPHAPLRADLVIPLFQVGECRESQFDRHRRDRGDHRSVIA